MRPRSGAALTLLAILIDTVTAKCNSWQTQVNISICNWQGLRANIIRDTIYIDGGELWLQQGYSDGCVNYVNDGNLAGSIYSLNLTTPFNTSSNFMDVLTNTSIAGGAANNIAPNYVEGAMFANDDEFFLYGGMLRLTNSTESPPDNTILGYEAYQYGAYRNNWDPGWREETLPTNITRYITSGASVSVPSENMDFLFSGMRASNWGSFTYDRMDSNMTANTLISVNLTVMRNKEWTNNTLPSYIPGRAGAELVWVPVSEFGVLVAIGGVVDPVEFWRDTGLDPSQTTLNEKVSPLLMETVSVYDVDSHRRYLQNTTGETPPQLTQFCSVLASANDESDSSHNIYIYGGCNGYEYDSTPSDDVYILSLPSFKWIQAFNGTTIHGRSGHRCIKVYPNQMLAIGGLHVDPTNCVDGGVVVNFDLNTLAFQSTYDPAEWSVYKVPGILSAEIGGNKATGSLLGLPQSSVYFAACSELDSLWDFGFYRRHKIQPQRASAEEPERMDTDNHKLTDERGATSPGPSPASHSTGVETTQISSMSAATPVTVESGGDAIYEIQEPPASNSATSSISPPSRRRPSPLPITSPQAGMDLMISERSGGLEGRDGTRRIPGSDTIHGKE
ncbi:hypothetical protein N7523_004426 [Penicillium sp. IBT 18751x]|nr:hypothetical protein N7523_004426 [Penicillium sp. IBT 18751x]